MDAIVEEPCYFQSLNNRDKGRQIKKFQPVLAEK